MCEAFGCLPSAAAYELRNDVRGMIGQVLTLRDYARERDRFDRAGGDLEELKPPYSDLMKEVMENDHWLHKVRIGAAKLDIELPDDED